MIRTAIQIIEQNDYFMELSGSNKARLAEICIPKNLKKKEHIFLEGDKGYALYFCAEGAVQLYKTSETGQEVVLKVVRPGELFGEVVLFEKDRYPASAVALEESRVFLMPKIQFHCLLEDPEFRNEFISILMQKMRYLAEKIQYLTSCDVEERFRRFIRDQYGSRDAFSIDLSKKDIAAAIGTTPESLSRLIDRMKKEGKMTWTGRKITLHRSA